MLQIFFFCDDNPFQLKLYTELAQKCILLQNWDIKITCSTLTQEDLTLTDFLPEKIPVCIFWILNLQLLHPTVRMAFSPMKYAKRDPLLSCIYYFAFRKNYGSFSKSTGGLVSSAKQMTMKCEATYFSVYSPHGLDIRFSARE